MKHASIVGLALCALVIAQPVSSQYGGPGGGRPSATFFVKDDFGGRSVTVDRPVRSFRAFDMNDKVSSIAIQSGRWLVCQDDDFRGRCEVIDRSIHALSRLGMDDSISSARPLDGAGYGGGGGDRGGWGGGPSDGPLPRGSWAGSCRNAGMLGSTLQAQCKDERGQWRNSQINARQCSSGRIGNRSGMLVCE